MLHIVIGVARSGKSEYAEKFISQFAGAVAYVGTLPDIPQYRASIERHQQRRPTNWSLVELIGDPATDIKLVSDALATFPNVLLDGMTFYILQLLTIFDEDLCAVRGQIVSLLQLTAEESRNVLITDPPVPRQLSPLPRKAHVALRDMHRLLARKAATITFISEGKPTPLSQAELLRLDRIRFDVTYDSRLRQMLMGKEIEGCHA